MTTANRRNITNVYRIKRIKPTKTSYAGQTNAQTHNAQKFKSGKPGGRHGENVPDYLRKKPRAEPPTPRKKR